MVSEAKLNEHLSDAYLALVGNKIDVGNETEGINRQVSQEEAKEYADKNKLLYEEVSARKNIGVHQLFDKIAKQMLVTH